MFEDVIETPEEIMDMLDPQIVKSYKIPDVQDVSDLLDKIKNNNEVETITIGEGV